MGYVAEGEWDLLGSDKSRIGLVAGEGFEPSDLWVMSMPVIIGYVVYNKARVARKSLQEPSETGNGS